jgi:hypothetical protein
LEGHDASYEPACDRPRARRRPDHHGRRCRARDPGAQAPCKPWKEVAQYLGQHYSEHPVAVGLQSDGSLLQVYAAQNASTWTLVNMRPDGMACLISAGKAWEKLTKPKADPAA